MLGTSILAADAGAQTYPNRPIRCIVPYVAGASPDVVARIIGPKLSERLGQAVVIDNRGGANSIIGTETAARSLPDGYTILLGATALATNPSLYKLPYDAGKSFSPITQTVAVHFLLVVHPSLPVRTVSEFVALARARPGELTYGSSGTGSPGHLAGELFKNLTGTQLVHVSYKGGPQATADLIGGQIQLQFDVIATSLQYVKAGKTRALAVSSVKRSTILPDMRGPSRAADLKDYSQRTRNRVPALHEGLRLLELVRHQSAGSLAERLANPRKILVRIRRNCVSDEQRARYNVEDLSNSQL